MSEVLIDLKVLDLLRLEGGRLAFMGDVSGAADRGGGVKADAVVELLVGEEVPQRRQVLLLAGRGEGVAVLVHEVVLQVIADEVGGDVAPGDLLGGAPGEEAVHGALVGQACVGVADAGLEEVGVGVLGVAAALLDDRRR